MGWVYIDEAYNSIIRLLFLKSIILLVNAWIL